jgi:hypothetical protein
VCAYTALKHKKEQIEVAEWFMYEDGKTVILISLARDLRRSHSSPRLLTRRIIIAYVNYMLSTDINITEQTHSCQF